MKDMLSNKKLLFLPPQAGQTVIEVLIATGVVALVMTAVAAAMTVSVKNTAESKYRSLAVKLNQESIELFRRERDRMGWESFREVVNADGVTVTYCLGSALPTTSQSFIDLTNSAECNTFPQAGTAYTREVVATVANPDLIELQATVSWADGTQTRSVIIDQDLQNWR
jgi:Tfp pilus assembly protein PilV